MATQTNNEKLRFAFARPGTKEMEFGNFSQLINRIDFNHNMTFRTGIGMTTFNIYEYLHPEHFRIMVDAVKNKEATIEDIIPPKALVSEKANGLLVYAMLENQRDLIEALIKHPYFLYPSYTHYKYENYPCQIKPFIENATHENNLTELCDVLTFTAKLLIEVSQENLARHKGDDDPHFNTQMGKKFVSDVHQAITEVEAPSDVKRKLRHAIMKVD